MPRRVCARRGSPDDGSVSIASHRRSSSSTPCEASSGVAAHTCTSLPVAARMWPGPTPRAVTGRSALRTRRRDSAYLSPSTPVCHSLTVLSKEQEMRRRSDTSRPLTPRSCAIRMQCLSFQRGNPGAHAQMLWLSPVYSQSWSPPTWYARAVTPDSSPSSSSMTASGSSPSPGMLPHTRTVWSEPAETTHLPATLRRHQTAPSCSRYVLRGVCSHAGSQREMLPSSSPVTSIPWCGHMQMTVEWRTCAATSQLLSGSQALSSPSHEAVTSSDFCASPPTVVLCLVVRHPAPWLAPMERRRRYTASAAATSLMGM
mmetsp:Transcript_14143/g.45116  ORF Transcript_14143/g.45116 Transcript_14143/m.45116 type:complete len:314 (-) Transcript_14143:3165-4106(-)